MVICRPACICPARAGFGMIVLPIMLYNQIQIMVGAMLARRYASGGLGASGLRARVVDP